ncbi:hypothetical protein WJX64_07550 [Leifsonia sp. YIM 134122]|uniref:Uncharacterized protein n=1 Tax=Leifsonia stereocauli TaxID=3134136 RepID=A0ABU9W315_9MICO
MPVRRTLAVGFLLASSLLALVGCTVGGSVAESTTPSPAPARTTPEPTSVDPVPAVDPLDVVVALVARPTALELRASDASVVDQIDYLGSAADAVATLTALFGTDPIDESYAATNHAPAGIRHVWGTLTIDERLYDEAMRAEKGLAGSLVWPNVAVYFDAADNGEIALSTVQGYAAGDDWATVSAAADVVANPSGCTGPAAELGDDPVEDTQVAVVLSHEDGGDAVLSVAAPVPFYTDGCV